MTPLFQRKWWPPSTDLFDNLEEDILSFGLPPSNNNIPIILCGDFNSRCSELNDFITNDLDDEKYNFNDEIIENSNDVHSLNEFGITLNRSSHHKKVNNYERLIQSRMIQ